MHVNARAAQILGQSVTELFGPIPRGADLRITDTRGNFLEWKMLPGIRAMESGLAVGDEILGFHQADGTVNWFSASAEPLIRQSQSHPSGAIVILRPVNRMSPGEDPLSKYREWLRWATRIRQVFEFENDFERSLRSCMELMAHASEASSVLYLGFRGGYRSAVITLRQRWSNRKGFDKPSGAVRMNLLETPVRDWLAILRAAEVLEIGGEEVPEFLRKQLDMNPEDRIVLGFLLASGSASDSQGMIALIRRGDRGAFNPFELDVFRLILSSIANELSRQLAEKARERQMTRFRRLFRVTPLLIAVMELKGTTLSIVEVSNSSGVDRLEDQMVGRTDSELGYSVENSEMRRSAARLSMKEARPVRIEYPRESEETTIWEEATFSYLDSHSRSHFFSVVVRDITSDRLERRQKAQKQKLEAMGRFTGSIAHDLNNLLQPPLTYVAESRDLIRTTGDPEAILEKLEIAMSGLSRSRELVRRLLTFTRQARPAKGSTLIHKTLAAVIESYRAALPANTRLEWTRTGEDGYVALEPSALEQVAVNLIRNSVRALSPGGGKIEVKLCDTETEPRAFFLIVQDDGPGIPANQVARIFEPFYSGNPRSGNTGLGLSIVENLVNEAGGSIEVDTVVESGTSMRILLPEVFNPTDTMERDSIEKLPAGVLHFCIVDDDPMVARALQSGLESMGQQVHHFSDPDEALIAIRTGLKPDIVVLDQILGEKRGTDFAPLFRKNFHGNLIMVSGNPEVSAEEALQLGIDSILTKPVFPDELMAAILSLRSDEK